MCRHFPVPILFCVVLAALLWGWGGQGGACCFQRAGPTSGCSQARAVLLPASPPHPCPRLAPPLPPASLMTESQPVLLASRVT